MKKIMLKKMSRIPVSVGYILLIWMAFCLFSTFTVELENQLNDKALASTRFSEMCIDNQGKVRHEQSLISVNMYCMHEDGNETLFNHEYQLRKFMMNFFDKYTFRLFDLK
jgi:hypothetical protein